MESMNHVAETQIQEMMGQENWDKFKSEQFEKSKTTIKERVSAFCSEMDNKFDSCSFMVDDIRITRGVPCLEILKTADAVNADLIVIGKHGYNILEASLLGGTARRVIKDSKKPVMVIRLPE
jgi:nucleotide-binding universal stress UspA family protein